ncbi:MAG: glucuronate isomerase [Bacteroidetes bacterium]|nr:glucuronate isomerase [Bacteroidota bacterium]
MSFITEDFLLSNDFSKKLYHDFAKGMPIIDYHCHLPPNEIASNKKFRDITEIWLDGDHYKWRAMRVLGVDENLITGSASPYEKFIAWAKSVPHTVRNPLYHWTHLELERYFGIDELLDGKSADKIWHECNEKLASEDYTVKNLLLKMKVETVCTTDDPSEPLTHHEKLGNSGFNIKMLPTFRPDNLFKIDGRVAYLKYLERFSVTAGVQINSFSSFISAVEITVEKFSTFGCKLSDHGFEQVFSGDISTSQAETVFNSVLNNNPVSSEDSYLFKSFLLNHLSKLYHSKGWVQQFHLGAVRDANTRMLAEIGSNAGIDSIGDFEQAITLQKFFDKLNTSDQLAKTILYNLNPSQNEVFATMLGNFNGGSTAGKMQFGSSWWFLDQKDGMQKQMNALSNMGLISQFVGMVTDSRSFLSYPRHEYFRRILCDLFGSDVANGELPNDIEFLGSIIKDICYNNAKKYFGF